MAMSLGSFTEHAEVIAVLGILFGLWSSKRILGKLEKNDSDTVKALEELDAKIERDLKEIEQRCENRVAAVYLKMDQERVLRDTQVNALSQQLSLLLGEHNAIKHNAIEIKSPL